MEVPAKSFWVSHAEAGEIRAEPLASPGTDDVVVRAVASGVSRGTESLVFRGRVPEGERETMRCPHQQGDFGGPVKYGYASVGDVVLGPPELVGRRVFCLHPHQDLYVVPAADVHLLPPDLPPQRAVLAANMETAINALWDAAPRIGDRVSVIGAGVVGALTAALAARIPGVDLDLVETDDAKRGALAGLGLTPTAPAHARPDRDVVIHATGTGDGLALAIAVAGFEALILELSWYGEGAIPVALGGRFHSQRLTLRSSQVGHVASARRARRERKDRLALALSLLAADARFDALLTSSCSLAELPARMPELARGQPGVMCHVVTYP